MAKSKEEKVVSMNTEEKEESKISYEQLERVAQQYYVEGRQIAEKLQRAEHIIASFNELEVLVNIISKGEYFHMSFIERCTAKIEEIVTKMIDASEKAEENKEEKKEEE